MLQNVIHLLDELGHSYNLAFTNYMNALDGYIRNKVKIVIIQ